MKKIKTKLPAFSLAEALITLLIVCLITLASIPVLTKKKRTISDGARGKWMCTRNSLGQYVVYNSIDPSGNIDNPETWQLSQNGTGCTFTPPLNAKNFGITVVGGGGGGADGVSKIATEANYYASGTYGFTPNKTDMYDVILIAGGGGGGDSQSSHANCGGGAGGGGAFYGKIPLFAGASYTIEVGSGGDSGGAKYHGGWSNSTSHGWAADGGNTSLVGDNVIDKKTNISVAGGQGGEGVGCSKWKCRGGSAGEGRSVITSDYYTNLKIGSKEYTSSVAKLDGESGNDGDRYGDGKTLAQGGKNLYENAVGNETVYGNGGRGGCSRNHNKCNDRSDRSCHWGALGVGGYATIFRTIRQYGQGGKSAVPVTYFLSSFPGKLEVTIGDKAESGKSGENTVAVIKKSNVAGRTFVGYGAASGIADESLSGPQAGYHSQITMTGGGSPAPECTQKRIKPAGFGSVTKLVKNCTEVKCQIQYADKDYVLSNNSSTSTDSATGVTTKNIFIPNGFYEKNGQYYLKQEKIKGSNPDYGKYDGAEPYIYEEPDSFLPFTDSLDSIAYLKNELNIHNYIRNLYCHHIQFKSCFKENVKKNSYNTYYNEAGAVKESDSEKIEFAGYKNADAIYENYKCFGDSHLNYIKVCTQDAVSKEKTFGFHKRTVIPASCIGQGGDGAAFGAGGGGGNAGDSNGASSDGGKGGYGGVIVEW